MASNSDTMGAVTPTPEWGTEDQPVAIRYKDRNGRWRYLNYPFTEGWTFPPNLGTPIPLYDRACGVDVPVKGQQ